MSLRSLAGALGRLLGGGRSTPRTAPQRSPSRSTSGSAARVITPYDAAAHGMPRFEYAPSADGEPDPGEVVWGWVPYEDDPHQGKDRPVLVVGHAAGGLVGLQLTSKDHDRDAADELRYGRVWLDVGAGAWDSQRRPSEVRLDRLLLVPPQAVRREGGALAADRFAAVTDAVRQLHGQ